jgi:aspartyl-tRNA(Asn)/glutamyl-tRNA(Gln) amidotransferase subunit B
MRSAAEAVAYAKALHSLVRWIGICDGNMQEGSFRCDANVSVRPRGADKLGTRCEIKNLNSFRFLERAIQFEASRQIDILEEGGTIRQDTRLYDADRDETRPMRSKEDAHDYRYFPDPDLPVLEIPSVWIEQVRASLPELPEAKRVRYVEGLGLTEYDAATLSASRETASYFEALMAELGGQAKLCANWVMGELAAALNRDGAEIGQSKVSSAALAVLLKRVAEGAISGKVSKDVFEQMWNSGASADAVIAAQGLRQISDSGALEKIVDEVIAEHPAQAEDYRGGREKVLGFLVGQAMKHSKGQANPGQLNEIFRRRLAKPE